MRYIYAHTLMALVLLLAGGCGGVRNTQTAPAVAPSIRMNEPRPPTDSENLLVYFGHLRKLQSAEIAKELDVVRQSYVNSRSDFDRVRYAMVLSVPGTAFYDDARALEAIDPLLKNQNSALYNLAFMVNAQVQEQRRAQGLQQKLDALRSLDKNLIERDTGGAKRK